jgi:hypothetical protein
MAGEFKYPYRLKTPQGKIKMSLTLHRSLVLFKCLLTASLIAGLFFFSAIYLERMNYHVEPKEVIYKNVTLKIRWPPKGERHILLIKDRRTVFVSSCDGMNENVCKGEMLGQEIYAQKIAAIQLSNKKGILKYGVVRTQSGKHFTFRNDLAEKYISSYLNTGYYPAYMAFFFGLFSLVIIFFIRTIETYKKLST